MLTDFCKHTGIRKKTRIGQTAVFMVLLMAVIILAIAGTKFIGDLGFIRLRIANIADSALISGASAFCRGLNQIRISHTSMLYNYINLQAKMLSRVWPTKYSGYAYAIGYDLYGIKLNEDILKNARAVAKDMTKELRVSMYDAIIGGALVEEPKPFIEDRAQSLGAGATPPAFSGLMSDDTCDALPDGWNEIGRFPDGRLRWIDYKRYLFRDSHITCEYRRLKKGTGIYEAPVSGELVGGKDIWYLSTSIAYLYNKGLARSQATPGKFISDTTAGLKPADFNALIPSGDPESLAYDSYVKADMLNLPTEVKIRAQPMVILFFYLDADGVVRPGFVPHPCAWISSVSFGNSTFGMKVAKFTPKWKLPFFQRNILLENENKVRIKGNIWIGYDFQMVE